MSHEVETMFSGNRETPWHGLGNVVDGVLTAEEAIIAAGLDWEVELRDIYRRKELINPFGGKSIETYEKIPNRYELTRVSDGSPFAVLSDKYKPFQNRDAFTFMDRLVESGQAHYETAGSLKGGRVVFITMQTPDYITLPGGDKIKTYLLLRTTHDGTGRIMVYVVTVRVVCWNTLTWGIEGARHKWGVTHTSDVQAKVHQAQQALGFTIDYDEAFRQEAEALMAVRVTDDKLVALLKDQIEDRPKRLELIDRIVFNVNNSPTVAGYEGTGWGVFNGVTEQLEHNESHRSDTAQFVRMFEGDYFKLRTGLTSKILSLA
jgi:phage/plasmid-like protein (TIGR03299 family)